MRIEDMFLGGLLMALFLFGMDQKEVVTPYLIIAIRLDSPLKLTPVLKEVIKDAFFEG